jgi:hypothetical protein
MDRGMDTSPELFRDTNAVPAITVRKDSAPNRIGKRIEKNPSIMNAPARFLIASSFFDKTKN